MQKYFSYEGCEGELSVHATLEAAKAAAIENADKSYHYGGEWNGSFSDKKQDGIRRTSFGVILGDFSLPTRPLTEDEQEKYGDEFSYMIERPQLVEYPQNQNNGWINRQDKLPNENENVLAWIENRYRPEYKSVTITTFYDGEFEVQAAAHFNVLYWQSLPQPPCEK